MLSSLLKEHQIKQQRRRELQEGRKSEALAATSELANALVDSLNAGSGVSQAYENQKKIDAETKKLQGNISLFMKQTAQWLKLMSDFNTSLKELGDVENWSRSIEADMHTISSALEFVYKGDGHSASPGQ